MALAVFVGTSIRQLPQHVPVRCLEPALNASPRLCVRSSAPASAKVLRQRSSFRKQSWVRRRGVARAAHSPAVSEDSEEISEKELPSPEQAQAEAGAGPAGDVAWVVKAALDTGDEAAVEEAAEQVRELQADRDRLAEALGSMEKELATSRDRLLRLSADFDNFRKRSDREKVSLASNVKASVMESLLPVVDSFEQAKAVIKIETEGEQRIDSSYQGIYKQFVEVMKGMGVSTVETLGKEFNPEVHEAIMREDSEEFPEGIVLAVFRKGFFIGDRLVRPAMVKVSAGPGPSPSTTPAAATGEGGESAAPADGAAEPQDATG